jgi:hypothetical protein
VAGSHHQLALVALVHHADVANVPFVKLHQCAASLFELALHASAHLARAGGIDQNTHPHPGPGAFRIRCAASDRGAV